MADTEGQSYSQGLWDKVVFRKQLLISTCILVAFTALQEIHTKNKILCSTTVFVEGVVISLDIISLF